MRGTERKHTQVHVPSLRRRYLLLLVVLFWRAGCFLQHPANSKTLLGIAWAWNWVLSADLVDLKNSIWSLSDLPECGLALSPSLHSGGPDKLQFKFFRSTKSALFAA